MSNQLEPLVEAYEKTKKFKEASDIFFDCLRREDIYARQNAPVKFTPIDIKYGDGYFVIGTGTNSVVHFHLEETPGWLYGLWLSEMDHPDPKAQKPVKIKFFAQFEAEIDEFKPSTSMVSEECTVSMGLVKSIECTHIKTAIHFIQKNPALAWHRYMPDSVAERRYELYLKGRIENERQNERTR